MSFLVSIPAPRGMAEHTIQGEQSVIPVLPAPYGKQPCYPPWGGCGTQHQSRDAAIRISNNTGTEHPWSLISPGFFLLQIMIQIVLDIFFFLVSSDQLILVPAISQ